MRGGVRLGLKGGVLSVVVLPFLRWLVAHPAVQAGRTTTAFLSDYPPLSAPPVRLPTGPWDGAWQRTDNRC